VETKTVRKTVWKSVPREVDVTIFIARDGDEFDSIAGAREHEEYLDKMYEFNKKYKTKVIKTSELLYNVVYIDELTNENVKEIHTIYPHINDNELRVGPNMIHTDDSGDNCYQYVCQPIYLIRELEYDLKILRDL
jgi:hypothetical protein